MHPPENIIELVTNNSKHVSIEPTFTCVISEKKTILMVFIHFAETFLLLQYVNKLSNNSVDSIKITKDYFHFITQCFAKILIDYLVSLHCILIVS